MANSKKKPMFHAPQKTGKMRKIPTSLPVRILSVVSLVLLAALTAFAIYAMTRQGGESVSSGQFSMQVSLMYLLLPVIGWIIALGFRLAVRFIPLEMWRLPMSIREATIKTEGRYLKLATLLVELETVLVFGYIILALYQGMTPSDLPILIWVAAVVGTIIACSRYVEIAAERQK